MCLKKCPKPTLPKTWSQKPSPPSSAAAKSARGILRPVRAIKAVNAALLLSDRVNQFCNLFVTVITRKRNPQPAAIARHRRRPNRDGKDFILAQLVGRLHSPLL